MYISACAQRLPLGNQKSGRLWRVVIIQKYLFSDIFMVDHFYTFFKYFFDFRDEAKNLEYRTWKMNPATIYRRHSLSAGLLFDVLIMRILNYVQNSLSADISFGYPQIRYF